MPRQSADIARSLTTKGFRPTSGEDHHRFWLYIGETKQAIHTKLSRGTQYRTIGDDLLSQMAKQVKLRKAEFLDLVDCPMSGADYIARLKSSSIELNESGASAASLSPPGPKFPSKRKKRGK